MVIFNEIEKVGATRTGYKKEILFFIFFFLFGLKSEVLVVERCAHMTSYILSIDPNKGVSLRLKIGITYQISLMLVSFLLPYKCALNRRLVNTLSLPKVKYTQYHHISARSTGVL